MRTLCDDVACLRRGRTLAPIEDPDHDPDRRRDGRLRHRAPGPVSPVTGRPIESSDDDE